MEKLTKKANETASYELHNPQRRNAPPVFHQKVW